MWRQPRNDDEARNVLSAAAQDPMEGYAWDGDDHWTSAAVHDWWAGRHRVVAWIDGRLGDADPDLLPEEIVRLREFREYIDGALHDDLMRYALWLDGTTITARTVES